MVGCWDLGEWNLKCFGWKDSNFLRYDCFPQVGNDGYCGVVPFVCGVTLLLLPNNNLDQHVLNTGAVKRAYLPSTSTKHATYFFCSLLVLGVSSLHTINNGSAYLELWWFDPLWSLKNLREQITQMEPKNKITQHKWNQKQNLSDWGSMVTRVILKVKSLKTN
jgi:hypothetical protein